MADKTDPTGRTSGLPKITLVLTFDDGPHATGDSPNNHTLKVLNVLENNSTQSSIKAAFFVQTEVQHRKISAPGLQAVKTAYQKGHLIAIHTGSTKDHAEHWKRVTELAYDVDGDKKPDGATGLESDMLKAKQHILSAVGEKAKYVRAVGGQLNEPWSIFGRGKVVATYKKCNLKHIDWDVDSHDNQKPRPAPEQVKKNLQEQVSSAILGGKREIVVLFHDINGTTADNLATYIYHLSVAARDQLLDRRSLMNLPADGSPGVDDDPGLIRFASSRAEIDTIFANR
jgi:peptidoglycan/xylan/chitin deacetylase (PgdA/CDA1 family)